MATSPRTQPESLTEKGANFYGHAKLSKFIRPEVGRPGQITDRDLDIFDAVLRYRFCSAARIVQLAGGNEDVAHRGQQ
jgi:hypothetical protein